MNNDMARSTDLARTTIMAYQILIDRVSRHVEERGDKLVDFYNRAIINQLERENDWDIRDLVEQAEQMEKGNV